MQSKYRSRRWMITVWSMLLITFQLIIGTILQVDLPWFGIILPILGFIPTAYIGAETYSKTHPPNWDDRTT